MIDGQNEIRKLLSILSVKYFLVAINLYKQYWKYNTDKQNMLNTTKKKN